MDIEKLQEELRKLAEQIQEIRSKEEHTAEDVTKLNELCGQAEEKDAILEAEERATKITASLNQATSDPAPQGQPNVGERKGFGYAPEDSEEDKYRKFGEYLQAVARAGSPAGMMIAGQPCGVIDRRLIYPIDEARAMGLEEGTPSLGGFLVQKDYAAGLISKAHETSILFNRVRKIPISANSNGLKLKHIDETSRANGSRWGGVQAYWEEESGTKTASKPKFGMMELSLKKLIGLCYTTDELLQDASALGAVISQGFAEEFGFKLDDSIINGTGAGQPLGILNAACLVTVAKESGQTATTIIWENIKNMYARIWARSINNMIVLINQDCLPQLMNMSMPVGTGGVPVWMPAGGASGKPYNTMFGQQVISIEQCQTLGTKGDIFMADLSQFIMITKGAMQSASSIHVKFTTDETVFRFVYRVDGQPLWNAALTPYKGSNTQSPFITLAVRS